MCTLIVGRGVRSPGTVLVAANRDERPERASAGPGVLFEHPRVIGGRDAVAGGTWLAIRDGRAVVALLNRRDPGAPAAGAARRSRGLLTLEVATAPADATLASALAALAEAAYAPFSLLYVSPETAWLLAHDGHVAPRVESIPDGWHVITHADLDDASEPRTARLVHELASFRPADVDHALERLGDLMCSHGDGARPPVCLHDGVMRTVSSTLVAIEPGQTRYLHADGRPCETPFVDHSQLLEGRNR